MTVINTSYRFKRRLSKLDVGWGSKVSRVPSGFCLGEPYNLGRISFRDCRIWTSISGNPGDG